MTVTLDLNGYQLARKGEYVVENIYGTQYIYPRNSNILIVSSGATLILEDSAGGGVLNLNGGVITGNWCTNDKGCGGIWNEGTINVQGSPAVYGNNTARNIHLSNGNPIHVVGELVGAAHLGILCDKGMIITDGYSEHNSTSPGAFFESDRTDCSAVLTDDGEAQIVEGITQAGYMERSWSGGKVVSVSRVRQDIDVFPNSTTVAAGWYYLNDNVTVDGRVSLEGDTSIILRDGKTLDVKGLYIPQGSTLTIYGQSAGTGKIYSHPGTGAGIGGKSGSTNGSIVIHGGIIEATGADHCAGIGTNDGKTGGAITIYGGTITAIGGEDGAAIGGGRYCDGGDGSMEALRACIADETRALSDLGFSAFLDAWCPKVVAAADDRAIVGAVSGFWRLASAFLALWVIGAALVAAGLAANALLARHMLRQAGDVGVAEDPDVLLRVDHLCQYFRSGDQVTRAVDDVSFFVRRGEVFGLVGESGCGKTTTGRTIVNLYDTTSGDVYFEGLRVSSGRNGLPVLSFALRREADERIEALHDAMKAGIRQTPGDGARLRSEYRAAAAAIRRELAAKLAQARDDALAADAQKRRAVQAYRKRRHARLTMQYKAEAEALTGAVLDARRREYEQAMKAARKENVITRMQMIFQDPIASIDPRMTVREIIAEGLRIRGVTDSAIIDQKVCEMLDLVGLVPEHADRYPHEFSGGQRQRIGIARAIALEPELIIADEPISALDVSIQAQIINLLNDLRRSMGLTIVFIAHNLSVVKYFSDRIAVMYFGKIVEMTTSEELFRHPLHPYTRALLSAIPYPDPRYEKQRRRLEYDPLCAHDYAVDKPSLREIAPGHWVYCNDAECAAYRRELGL